MKGLPSFLRGSPAATPMAMSPRPPAGDAPPLGLHSFGRDAPLVMHSFRDIPVVPVTRDAAQILCGGPIWPEWDRSSALRHQRAGKPVDDKPPLPDSLQRFDGAATWGGHVVPHFGHLLAEHGTRILQSLSQRPGDPMLFTQPAGAKPADAPGFFWQMTEWLGVAAQQVQFVTQPLEVSELHAVPMAEQWTGTPVSAAYLDLLDANAERQGLTPRPENVVYVARDRMARAAAGNNPGETYLASVLESLGVTVIRPETMRLRDQLAQYAGAELLIFAEGSALHGRQLLGRIDQHIVVLNRRPDMRIGWHALTARASQLSYIEATRATIAVKWKTGKPWATRATSLYAVDNLLDGFEALGIPLRRAWDQKAFEAARDEDIRTWLRIRLDANQPQIALRASAALVAAELRRLKLDHLAREVPQH